MLSVLHAIAETLIPGVTSSYIVQLELALFAIAAIISFLRPQTGTRFFEAIERGVRRLSVRPRRSIVVAGAAAIALRVALLPVAPIPVPEHHDEFSYLLAADTFAHGRLANPTHPMWIHFESIHISQQPTYASMYPPLQGLVLAAGMRLGGHPWIGVLFSSALMCAAITWMLQGWFQPPWDLLGGILVALRLGAYSYWINSYYGAVPAAIGGALAVGALARIKENPRPRYALILVFGVAMLLNSRPFEGLIVSAVAFLALMTWLARRQLQLPSVVRGIMLPAVPALIVVALAMGYYNQQVFGAPWRLPYQVNRATYGVAPLLVFQRPNPVPEYHHAVMRTFYTGWEMQVYRWVRSPRGFVSTAFDRLKLLIGFFLGPALWIPLLMFPASIVDRRIRLPVMAGIALGCGLLAGVWMLPHYAATATCVVYTIVLASIQRLRRWTVSDRRPGLFLSRAIPLICLTTVLVVTIARALGFDPSGASGYDLLSRSAGLQDRAALNERLARLPGTHLVIVRYAPNHDVHKEWVYNDADIDAAKVIWAREMEGAQNDELLQYFRNRRVWLVEPDAKPVRTSEYVQSR